MATTINTYVWKGTKRGQKTGGEIKGDNPTVLKTQLRRQGVTVTSFKKQSQSLLGGPKKIKPEDIAFFTRQMSTMLKAGVPLVQGLEMVAEGTNHKALASLVTDLQDDVASGTPFATALKKHPRYFDDLYCSVIEAGEQSGALETLMARVANYKEKAEALKKKVKKALTYPIAVIVVALVVTSILLIFVVPQFAETFGSFGATLPSFTLFVLGISESMQAHWWKILIVILILVFVIRELMVRSEKFVHFVDRTTLRIPVVGGIIYDGVVARFARTLSTTFAAGVPLVEALSSVSSAAGNIIYKQGIDKIQDDVTSGTQLNTSMRSSGLFPPLALQMTKIGEESGALDEMLERVADHYEESVDNKVDNLTALLEPFIMAVLGVLVGGILIAMYLPIFQLGQVV